MSVIANVEKWGNTHRPEFLDIFRIVLGVFLAFKGLYFAVHMGDLKMTTIVLVGLILFFVFGAGGFSLDAKRRGETGATMHH
jgi:uncharacterized membrane protein YphA (DoxX/SURF4 family)